MTWAIKSSDSVGEQKIFKIYSGLLEGLARLLNPKELCREPVWSIEAFNFPSKVFGYNSISIVLFNYYIY